MHFTDQLSRTVFLPNSPKRIISLVPSQTELLVDLGLEEKIVGVTKFCMHPDHLRKNKTIVGGTKNYKYKVINSLQPDLIIGNKEENDRDGIEKLAENYPVWMSDISCIEDNYEMIRQIGIITGTENRAQRIIQEIKASFESPIPKRGTCVYLIWNNPIMVAGQKTFINEMLEKAGLENVVKVDRYPVLELEELKKLNPEFLLLSSEPFPFKEKHLVAFQEFLPNSKILLADGELFSWYGSRLLHSAEYFRRL